MTVGDSIDSVYGGPADRERYPHAREPARDRAPRRRNMAPDEAVLQSIYADIRHLHDGQGSESQRTSEVEALHVRLRRHPGDWLARLELLELSCGEIARSLRCELEAIAQGDAQTAALIRMGLASALKAPRKTVARTIEFREAKERERASDSGDKPRTASGLLIRVEGSLKLDQRKGGAST
ncbi:MAG: hypothetical protein ACREUE_06100 [Panacagrimonas sp.]